MPNKKLTLTYPCSSIREYERFVQDDFLKNSLLAEAAEPAAFLEKAEQVIRQHVLAAIPNPGPDCSYAFLARLRAQGYDNGQVSRALAQAWLNGDDFFELPAYDLLTRLDKPLIRGAIAVLGALLLLLVFLLFLRKVNPDLAVAMLAFGPLMGIFVIPTALLIHAVLGKVFFWLNHRREADD